VTGERYSDDADAFGAWAVTNAVSIAFGFVAGLLLDRFLAPAEPTDDPAYQPDAPISGMPPGPIADKDDIARMFRGWKKR
jgi:hypothetical protein